MIRNEISLSRWLVDLSDGLYLIDGDNRIEPDIEIANKIRVKNSQIMLSICRSVPLLGGGRFSIFYRTEVKGYFTNDNPNEFFITELLINPRNQDSSLEKINVDVDLINKYREKFGDYVFSDRNYISGDWLDNL